MVHSWVSLKGDANIRQGDVVRALGVNDPTYAVILTADCDIAQRKMNNRMTVVRAVSVQDFLVRYWAAWELEKLAEKQARQIVPFLNSAAKALSPNLDLLTPERLADWVLSTSPSEIFNQLSLDTQKRSKEFDSLCAFKCYVDFSHDINDADGLRALSSAWDALGKPRQDIRERAREAISASTGFQDYVVIPNLPSSGGDGLVVLVREIFSVESGRFFKSEYAARIADGPEAYVRVGRLRDRVKFAISQRVAFVFSRIGMESSFEASCSTLADLVSLEIPE